MKHSTRMTKLDVDSFKEKMQAISVITSLMDKNVESTLHNNNNHNSFVCYIGRIISHKGYYYYLDRQSIRFSNNYSSTVQLKIVYNYEENTVRIRSFWSRKKNYKYILNALKAVNFEPKNALNTEGSFLIGDRAYVLDHDCKMSKANLKRITGLISCFLEYNFQ